MQEQVEGEEGEDEELGEEVEQRRSVRPSHLDEVTDDDDEKKSVDVSNQGQLFHATACFVLINDYHILFQIFVTLN